MSVHAVVFSHPTPTALNTTCNTVRVRRKTGRWEGKRNEKEWRGRGKDEERKRERGREREREGEREGESVKNKYYSYNIISY